MKQKSTLSLLVGFMFCFASHAEIANPKPPIEKNSSPFSKAYRGLTPLTEAAARNVAIHECELYQTMEQNVATTVEPVPELPDSFRVRVIGKFNGITITSSVLVHRFNPFKGSRIEATTADLEFVPCDWDLGTVTRIADDLRKVVQPSWELTCSNHVIRIKSKQSVWLLGPSLPGKDSGESEDHYARKNGYKTNYEVALTFVRRLDDDQLKKIRKVREPLERAFAKGVGSKAKASEFANALAQHPLPMFYTDGGCSVFVDWPYGSYSVYSPDAAAEVEKLVATLRKSFHEYNYPPPEPIVPGTLVEDPVKAITAVLPKGWVILKVQHNTHPSYRPKGKGTAIFFGRSGKKYLKQDYSAEIDIMPADYQDGGEDPTQGKAQTWPARLIAKTVDAKIYLWPGSEAEGWTTMQKDLMKALFR
jgi:hypothetical protein